MNIQNLNINFVGKCKQALIFSVLLILVTIGSFVFKGFNLGLDFTGGTLVEVNFASSVDASIINQALAESGINDAVVQQYGSDKALLVRVPPLEDVNPEKMGDRVYSAIKAQHPNVQLRRVEFVGPKVGKELTEQGGLATIVALIGILIYIMFRFEYRFAVGSVIALIHDVMLTLGVFSLFQIEFDLTVLAAVLAVIGYSLNDTIVVYDRIRENFRKLRKQTPESIVNTSINQTLSRTLVTSLTTLLVLISLYYLGGALIKGFAIALIIGVLVGTYSSIYIASSMILALGITRKDLIQEVRKPEEVEEGFTT